MSAPLKSGVFFDEDANLETWKLKQLASAAHKLVDDSQTLHAFIESNDEQGDRFLITVALTPSEPLFVYEATVVDENTTPQLDRRFRKE